VSKGGGKGEKEKEKRKEREKFSHLGEKGVKSYTKAVQNQGRGRKKKKKKNTLSTVLKELWPGGNQATKGRGWMAINLSAKKKRKDSRKKRKEELSCVKRRGGGCA